MKNQTVTIESAASRNARINEIPRLVEQIQPELSNHKTVVDNLNAKIANMQQLLDRENAPRVPGEMRHNPMRQSEKDQRAFQVRQLQEQLKHALTDYEPIQSEVDQLYAELEELHSNPPTATLADLKSANANLNALTVKISQIEQAAEEAASKCPTDQIEALTVEIDTLSADRDLMAADVDMGHGSDAELKSLTTKLTKAEKQLAEANATASKSLSTQRGYQRRLDALNSEQLIADAGFRAMLSLYAGEIHRAAVERLERTLVAIEDDLTDVLIANQLSDRYGDRSVFSNYSGRARIEFPGIHQIEARVAAPKDEIINLKAEEILQGITRKE